MSAGKEVRPSPPQGMVIEFHYDDGDVGAHDILPEHMAAVKKLWAGFSAGTTHEASHIVLRPATPDELFELGQDKLVKCLKHPRKQLRDIPGHHGADCRAKHSHAHLNPPGERESEDVFCCDGELVRRTD